MILRSGSRDVQIHQGKSWPCMHRVWIQCDSGVSVEKLTRHHVRFLQKVDFGLPRAKFSTRVDLDLEASRIFSTDTTQKFLVYSRAVVLVRCRDLGIQDLAPVSHKCTVPALESILAFRSESLHSIM